MRVVVLGGGVAGVFTALFLEERGFRVIKIGGEVTYPLTSLVLTQSMPHSEDVELARESLSMYQKFTTLKRVVSIDILPEWVPRENANVSKSLSDVKLESGEVAIISEDYLVPVRKVVKKLRRELGFQNSYGLLKVKEGRAYVVVDGSRVEGDVVVMAAGYANRFLAERANISIPLMPYECYAAVYIVNRKLWKYSIGDYVLKWYGRPATPPLYIAGNGCGEYGRGPPPNYARKIANYIARRGGSALPLHVKTGYCEVGPHGGPLYGRHQDVENLYIIGGFDGYGAMTAPALAKKLVDLISGRDVWDVYRIEKYRAVEFNPCAIKERHEWGYLPRVKY